MKFAALLCSVFFTCCLFAAEVPKNIIMVVGDGMGPAYTTAYRYFADDQSTDGVEPTVFDRHLVGMASTYPARESGYVTDSAASATALACGIKTYNGAIAVDLNKQPVLSVLQWARQLGKKTGVAVTSQINHATPAAYAAHNEKRGNYDQIADSYFDRKIADKFVLNVMLGGGWQYFIRDDRNLVDEFKRAGYQYIDQLEQLALLDKQKPVLGLFADKGLPWALDTQGKTRLPNMVKAAVQQLENKQGFFLLVEASQVDWAGHDNDIAAAMAEMQGLALTLEWLEAYVQKNPETLVVVTADHGTGGLTVAADAGYRWDPQPLKNLKASTRTIAKRLRKSHKAKELAEELLGFALNEEELALLDFANTPDAKQLYSRLKHILDKRSNTGWTTGGHTAIDVQIFAMGKHKALFAGHLDNTDIAKRLFTLMGKKSE